MLKNIKELTELINKKINENKKSLKNNSATTVIQNGTVTNNPEPSKLYFRKPGEKTYRSANKEKGPGTSQRTAVPGSGKPDTIFYQEPQKKSL